MSTEMRRDEIKQKLYKFSRHATKATIRPNIVPNSELESMQMVQKSCNNAGNMQIVQIWDVIHVSYKHLDVLTK